MIGSLLRVCSETYKQSNRNDNKTNNKDTQPRFEQDSTRSYFWPKRPLTVSHPKRSHYSPIQEAIRKAKASRQAGASWIMQREYWTNLAAFSKNTLSMASPSTVWEMWQLRAVEKIVCIYSLSKGMELGQPRGCRGDCGSFMSQNKRTSHTFWLSF